MTHVPFLLLKYLTEEIATAGVNKVLINNQNLHGVIQTLQNRPKCVVSLKCSGNSMYCLPSRSHTDTPHFLHRVFILYGSRSEQSLFSFLTRIDRFITTDKHNCADQMYWTFMQHYYIFRLYTSAIISLSHAYSVVTGYLFDVA